MRDNSFFIDTNIFVYALLEPDNYTDNHKHCISTKLLNGIYASNVYVSVQVLNEFYNVLLRYGFSDRRIQTKLEQIVDVVQITSLDLNVVKKCWFIKMRYKFSYWDSLIVASALESDCSILYTEDMQNEQIIDGRLKIVNPFERVACKK
jgi:predicted nucleic acid-binding protein